MIKVDYEDMRSSDEQQMIHFMVSARLSAWPSTGLSAISAILPRDEHGEHRDSSLENIEEHEEHEEHFL